MNLKKAEEAYMNDPRYSNLIRTLMGLIETLQMSPSEIREAAMFACIKLGQINTEPMIIIDKSELTDKQLSEFLKNPRYLVT